MEALFPGVDLHAMEDLMIRQAMCRHHPPRKSQPGEVHPLIGISAGGAERELNRSGMSETHVNDFTVRLTRVLLQHRFRVAFGGAIRPVDVKHDLTQAILDTAASWSSAASFTGEPEGLTAADVQDSTPIVNFVGRGFGMVDPIVKAKVIALCRYSVVEPVILEQAPSVPDDAMEVREFQACWQRLWALHAMRTTMAEECRARILFSGKTHGWSGRLPGIAEELLTTLKAGKPVFLVQGFGGCAELLHDFYKNPPAWPRELTYPGELEWRKEHDRHRENAWIWFSDHRERWFRELEEELTEFHGSGLVHLCSTRNLTEMLGEALGWLEQRGRSVQGGGVRSCPCATLPGRRV